MSVIISDIAGTTTATAPITEGLRPLFVAVLDDKDSLPARREQLERYMRLLGATELVVVDYTEWLRRCVDLLEIHDEHQREVANIAAISDAVVLGQVDPFNLEPVAGLFVDTVPMAMSTAVRQAITLAQVNHRPVFGPTGRI